MSFIMTFSCVYIMYFEDINFLFSSLIPYTPSHRSSSAFQIIAPLLPFILKNHIYWAQEIALCI